MSDHLDSRDLEDERMELAEAVENWTGIVNDGDEEERRDEYPGLADIGRYGELCQLADELSVSGWEHGIIFIPEADFTEYAQELAEDIGAIDREAGWPNGYIDWERAARDLRMDYSEIDIAGTAYYYREA